MAKKMKKQINILDPKTRFKLTKLLDEMPSERFPNWDEAAAFFLNELGVTVTQFNVRSSLNTLGKKNFRIVKKESGSPFFAVINRRLEAIEQRLTELENRR